MTSHSGVQPNGKLLPTEVFLEIFRYLEKDDLKSVRLVSRSCSHWVSDSLFDTVYISAHKEDFDVFNSLAKHPYLSKCVRHLKYDTSRFTSSISKGDYLRLLCGQLFFNKDKLANALRNGSDPDISGLFDLVTDRSEESTDPLLGRIAWLEYTQREAWLRYGTSNFVEEGHQKFLHCSSRQKANKKDERYWETVARGMRQFENLESGEMYAGWEEFDNLDLYMVQCSSHRYSSLTGSPLNRSWNPAHLCPLDDLDSDLSDETWDGTYEFAMMNQFLKWAPHPLKSFNMIGTCLLPTTLDVENSTCNSLLAEGFQIYARLETLKLCIQTELIEDESYYPMPGLIGLLDSATRLTHLVLTLPTHNGFSNEYYTQWEIFPSKHVLWPNLKTLALENISFDATHWMILLHFKLPMLSSLKVDEIELAEGSWEEVIECMHYHLNLSSFNIGSTGTGLVYPGQRLLWTRGVLTEGRDNSFQSYDEHKKFLRDIENYIVRGGRHPCLLPEQPDDAFHVGSEQLFSSVQNLMQHDERIED